MKVQLLRLCSPSGQQDVCPPAPANEIHFCCLPSGVDGRAKQCQVLVLLTNTHVSVLFLVRCILWVILFEFCFSP